MRRAGYRGVSLGRAVDGWNEGEEDSRRNVVLTFDDGNRSDHEHALPILLENGFTATFFVSGNRVGHPDGLGEPEIRALCAFGMEVGSHGMTHRFLSGLSKTEQEAECRRSRDFLTNIMSARVRFFSVPGGRYTGETMDILRALSYDGVCTSAFGYSRLGDDLFGLKRIPVTRSTNTEHFRGFLERAPRILLPAYVEAGSRALARRILGERLYARVRSRMIQE
jgi:peptidoglycan/xylan/chitin deacetylase (PgdA/CDA1 family)